MRTVRVAPERLERWLAGFAERHGAVTDGVDDGALLITGADGARAWLAPPFGAVDAADPRASLLAEALRPRRLGVVLARRRGAAAGVFDGADLVASKIESSYVQGTTKAGGWSQQRFARRRANQAAAAFDKAADAVAAVVLPQRATLDAVVRGGDRAAVDAVLADPRLAPLRALVVGPVHPVADPRLPVLRDFPAQFRAVTVRLDP